MKIRYRPAPAFKNSGSDYLTRIDQAVRLRDSQHLRFGTGGDSAIYFDGTDTFWDLRRVGSGDLMIALAGSFPSPDPGAVHIWRGSAGAVAAASQALLIIEDDALPAIQILSPNNVQAGIFIGDPESNQVAFILYSHSADAFDFRAGGADRVRVSIAGLKVGATTARGTTEPTNALTLFNGTAPAGTLVNGASLYAKDVTSSSELHVMDEAGNETLISPHDQLTGEWVFYSRHSITGRVLKVKMEQLVKKLEEHFGWGLIEETD